MMKIKRKEANYIFALLPLLTIYLFIFFIPIARILILSFKGPSGFTLDNFVRIIQVKGYLIIFLRTFKLGLTVTGICLVLGYIVSYLLYIVRDKYKKVIMFFIIIPFWTSLLVRTYAWMVILQRKGVINSALLDLNIINKPLSLIYNAIGVNIGMVNLLLPFVIITISSSMAGIDKNLMKAASVLGARPFIAFIKVFFPLSLPGVVGSGLLVFVMAIGFYITPALMGGLKDVTISMMIETQIRQLFDWEGASAMATILLIITVVIIYIYNRYLGIDKLWGGQDAE
jgi:putative spermidine/putrescine transport system permease protein